MATHVNNKKAFTLVELLIVTAIIGVLAAIAIPAFIGTLNRTKETVCATNRASVYRLTAYNMTVDPKLTPDKAFDQAMEQEIGCPDNGTFYLSVKDDGSYEVLCTKHGEGNKEVVYKKTLTDILKTFEEALKTNGTGKNWLNNSGNARLDSFGDGGDQLTKTMQAAVDSTAFDAIEAKSWALINNVRKGASSTAAQAVGKEFLWTDYDISDGSYDKKAVPTLVYNFSTGKYYAFTSNIISKKGDYGTYSILGQSAENNGTANGKAYSEGMSFADAIKEYNRLKAEFDAKNPS